MEPGLRTQAQKIEDKAEPRRSSNGFRWVSLNGTVKVTPSAQARQGHHEAVVCRHFATEFAQHPGKKAELMKLLSKRNGIKAKFDGQLSEVETSFKTIIRETPQGYKHLVSSDHLGSYLTALAATLNDAPEGPNRPKEANCLLLTHNHVMALHVQRKRKDGVDYFSAKLYDPNDTATYKRVVRLTAEELGPLTLKDMMISPRLIRSYAGKGNTSLSMVAMSLNHDLQPQIDRSVTTHSAQNLHLALSLGVHPELPSMLQEVLNSNLSDKGKAELLAAKTGDGTPGLFLALKSGQAETVNAFTDAALKSNLEEKVKAELLAAKRSDGTPGLGMALCHGNTETVNAFTDAVLHSNLDEKVKAELLAAECDQPIRWSGDQA